MSTRESSDGEGSTRHRLKGRVTRFLGWVTADRHVEAVGQADASSGGTPTDTTIEAVEDEVKKGYGETLDGGR